MKQSNLPDWSESLATMPARISTLTNFLHDRKFDKAASLISNLADDLNEVLDWIIEERKQELPEFGLGFITFTKTELIPTNTDLVPTMKLRWVFRGSPMVLQQWHYDRSKPDAAGQHPEGKWIDVPAETWA